MDYDRIYRDFIKDRRTKEHSLSGYTERHHIIPRCLGGGDEPGNLIDLTPEDHFFAHLCLAKTHGGKLWAPVAFMIGGQRKDYKPVLSRKSYGWASRAMAKALCGEGASSYDWTIHELEHKDGRVWSGTQYAMTNLGISRSLANMMLKGRIRAAKGWYIKGRRPTHFGHAKGSGADHHMYRSESITFLHLDGRKFVGTQFEFHQACGVSKGAACTLARGKARMANGWYVEGRPPVRKGRGARWFKTLEPGATSLGSKNIAVSQRANAG